ncbi:hypothetical protein CB1_000576095 [Camelus ferus]|nr:hypothetical protein CB1_000576095 [Camelus ferus]
MDVDKETSVAYVVVDKENIENRPKKVRRDVDVVYVDISKGRKSVKEPGADEPHSVPKPRKTESERLRDKVRKKKHKKRRRKAASCDAVEEGPGAGVPLPPSEPWEQEAQPSVGCEGETTHLTGPARKHKSKKRKRHRSNREEFEASPESAETGHSEGSQVVGEVGTAESGKQSSSMKKKSKKRKRRSVENAAASGGDFSVLVTRFEDTPSDALEDNGTLMEDSAKPRPREEGTQACLEEVQRLEPTNEEESSLKLAKDSERKYLFEDLRGSGDRDVDLDSAVKQLQEFIPDIRERAATTIKRMYRDDLGRFKEFKAQGVTIKFGKFSVKENKQLEKNVQEFLSLTGIDNADKLLYADRYPEEKSTITNLKRKHSFRLHIGKGIARPWKLVYYRAKKMFDVNNYKGRYSKGDTEKVKIYQSLHGNDWKKIGEMVSRSSLSVALKFSQISSQLREMNSRLQENPEGRLSIVREKLYKGISWVEVEAKVETRNWMQCKSKWTEILTKRMTNGRDIYRGVNGLQAKINLIERLYEINVEDVNEIDWEDLASAIGYRMSTCCWCTPGGVSTIDFLQRYASRIHSSEFQTANEDLCYCLECVAEYHKARDELPHLHEILWELETLRLINHFEKSMTAEMGDDDVYIVDNNGEAQLFDFTGQDFENKLRVPLLEILKYPYLLLHERVNDSVDPFWPALHCFMVILDRLGSKVWGQLIDPIEAFQTIINNTSYNKEIQNIRNSSVRAKLEPESYFDDMVTCSQIVYNYNPEKTKKDSGWRSAICTDYCPNMYEEMETLASVLQSDIGQDMRVHNSTFLWFIPFVQSLMDLKDLGVAYIVEHCTSRNGPERDDTLGKTSKTKTKTQKDEICANIESFYSRKDLGQKGDGFMHNLSLDANEMPNTIVKKTPFKDPVTVLETRDSQLQRKVKDDKRCFTANRNNGKTCQQHTSVADTNVKQKVIKEEKTKSLLEFEESDSQFFEFESPFEMFSVWQDQKPDNNNYVSGEVIKKVTEGVEEQAEPQRSSISVEEFCEIEDQSDLNEGELTEDDVKSADKFRQCPEPASTCSSVVWNGRIPTSEVIVSTSEDPLGGGDLTVHRLEVASLKEGEPESNSDIEGDDIFLTQRDPEDMDLCSQMEKENDNLIEVVHGKDTVQVEEVSTSRPQLESSVSDTFVKEVLKWKYDMFVNFDQLNEEKKDLQRNFVLDPHEYHCGYVHKFRRTSVMRNGKSECSVSIQTQDNLPIAYLRDFNEDQKKAIETAYAMVRHSPSVAKICLIHGPPGTGKSKTIVGLLYRLLTERRGHSDENSNAKIKQNRVLVCAPSNAAVDELMKKIILEFKEKCKDKKNPLGNCGDINLVRLGPEKSINNEVLKFSLDSQVNHRMKKELPSHVQEMHRRKEYLDRQLDELSRRRALCRGGREVQRQELDEKIVEVSKERQELASKIKEVQGRPQKTQSIIILESHIICCTLSTSGGLLLESAFRGQGGVPFSCVIVDEKAQEYGYDQSMMARFYKLLEESVEHNMVGRLPVLQLTVQYRMHPDICLFPSNYVYNRNLKTNSSYVNVQEIKLVMELIKLIKDKRRDVTFRNIGIITHYKAQKTMIQKDLDKEFDRKGPAEVDTVDAFQGRQKDCVIVTCVRANAMQGSIGFLASLQRLNVTITRAKYSLFILGHLRTLMENQHWNHLIQDAQKRGAIIKTCDKNYRHDAMKILKLKPVLQRSLTHPPAISPEASRPQGGLPSSKLDSEFAKTSFTSSVYLSPSDSKEATVTVTAKDPERPSIQDRLRDPRLLRRFGLIPEAKEQCLGEPQPPSPQPPGAAPPSGEPGSPGSHQGPAGTGQQSAAKGATPSNHRPHTQCDPPAASADAPTSKRKFDQEGGLSHRRETRAFSEGAQERCGSGSHHPKRNSGLDERGLEEDSSLKRRRLL